jgi:HTH-type transcriptional regulator, glycine betaine synthesis regulator
MQEPAAVRDARTHFIESTGRIAQFWGFPKALGGIYGAIFLSPTSVSLDSLVGEVGVTKGAVSTHVRALESLQLIIRETKLGDRKDYYTAEPDLWRVVKNVLGQREKVEFDRALRGVEESLSMLLRAKPKTEDAEKYAHMEARMRSMQSFFGTLDRVVLAILAWDDFRSATLLRLFPSRIFARNKRSKP